MPPHQPPSRVQSWYRQLIRLYPPAFRRRFGPEITQLFDDIHRDIAGLPPRLYRRRLTSLFLDTIVHIIREQFTNLRSQAMKIPALRSRRQIIITVLSLVVAVPVISFAAAFAFSSNFRASFMVWEGRLRYAVDSGFQAYRVANTLNTGAIDVTHNFIADYTDAKYNHTGRTDVGYHSPHAIGQSTPGQGQLTDFHYTLQATVSNRYTSTSDGFDPLLCSTVRPVSVSYDGGGMGLANSTQVFATFHYGNGLPDNVVLYDLRLDFGGPEPNGAWKISNVRCLSLDNAPSHPYVLAYGPLDNDYWHRNLP